jgi:hypothetical protein
MRLVMMRVMLVAWALAIGACASPPPNPEIVSRTVQGGKGVPNGKSEGPGPFLPLSRLAQDKSYGFSPGNPIKVGGAKSRVGSLRQRIYLNSLRGPNGEPIEYERKGACCPFDTANAEQGAGFLDVFKIVYLGGSEELTLYINMYDEAPLQVPVGFTARRSEPARPDPKRKLPVAESGYAERA